MTKFLTFLERTLANPTKKNRMQSLLGGAGTDLERHAELDASLLEEEVRSLQDEDFRTDFRAEAWDWKDWSYQ